MSNAPRPKPFGAVKPDLGVTIVKPELSSVFTPFDASLIACVLEVESGLNDAEEVELMEQNNPELLAAFRHLIEYAKKS